jgi:hemerythrin-like metal-binding protein
MATDGARAMTTGVTSMDDEHWGLLTVLAQLGAAVRAGTGPGTGPGAGARPGDLPLTLLDRLLAETTSHFASEERLMVDRRYPMATSHIAQHSRFAEELTELRAHCRDAAVAPTTSQIEHLETWFARHISIADQPLGEWLLLHRP